MLLTVTDPSSGNRSRLSAAQEPRQSASGAVGVRLGADVLPGSERRALHLRAATGGGSRRPRPLSELCDGDPVLQWTTYRSVDLADAAVVADAIAWQAVTDRGGEGMV